MTGECDYCMANMGIRSKNGSEDMIENVWEQLFYQSELDTEIN